MAHPAITLPISDYAVLHNSVSKYLRGATPSPWAILLTKFADDPSPDPDKEIYRRLFTDAGLGTNNMVKFFADVSHGKLDLPAVRSLAGTGLRSSAKSISSLSTATDCATPRKRLPLLTA